MRKKTYLFDNHTVDIIQILKEELGKKETQIIKEALRLYFDNHRSNEEILKSFKDLIDKIESIVEKVSELSYRLGRCEERNRRLDKELRKLRRK